MHHTSSEIELEIMLSFSMYSFPAPARVQKSGPRIMMSKSKFYHK